MDYVCPKCLKTVKLSTDENGCLTENTISVCPNCGEKINYINPVKRERKDCTLVSNGPSTDTFAKPSAPNNKKGNNNSKILGCAIVGIAVLVPFILTVFVAMVMVFGGDLRNALGKTNATLVQKTPEGAKGVGDQLRAEQEALDRQNKVAIEAGTQHGGDFSTEDKKTEIK